MQTLQVRVAQALSDKPKTSLRLVVVGMLLHRWINKLPPVKMEELAALSGAGIGTIIFLMAGMVPIQKNNRFKAVLASI